MKSITADGVRVKLRRRLNGTTQERVAADLGVSLSYLNQVLKGRPPGPKILTALGLERITTYRPLS